MTLRIGMIGPGGMGQAHIERIHSVIAGGRVVAVTDLNAEGAQKVADRIGATVFPSAAELISSDDVDAIMICSFGPAHEPDVIAALKAGKYVFCEKPLAPTAEACARIMEAEQKVGKKLVTVGFMRRFDASYREMKAILDAGEIGETLMVHNAHGIFLAYLLFLGSITVLFFLKKLVMSVVANISRRKDLFDELKFSHQIFCTAIALSLFPLQVIASYSDFSVASIFIYTSIYLVIILLILYSVRSLRLFLSYRVSFFFWFLYFCTLEMLPVAVGLYLLE